MTTETFNQIAEASAAADAWLADGARTRDRIGNAASDNMRFGFIEGFKAARMRGDGEQGQAVACDAAAYFSERIPYLRDEVLRPGGVMMAPEWHEKERPAYVVRRARELAAYEAALAALSTQPAPSAPVCDPITQRGLPDGTPQKPYAPPGYEIVWSADLAELKARARVENMAVGEQSVWYWQGDGQDFPESLVCPVIMSAESLRGLLASTSAPSEQVAASVAAPEWFDDVKRCLDDVAVQQRAHGNGDARMMQLIARMSAWRAAAHMAPERGVG